MNPVVHFEIPAKDRKRMAVFYTRIFGWQAKQLGEEMGNYVVVMTTECDGTGTPKERGQINGGFFQKSKENPLPSVVISVDNIKAHMKKVVAGGGKVLGKPMDIPGVGTYVSFVDTEGNRLSMLQALPRK